MILEQIHSELLALAQESDAILSDIYKEIDHVCLENSNRILSAFIENKVSYSDFSDINGYGNYDEGRDKLERIFASVLGCEMPGSSANYEWYQCVVFDLIRFIEAWRYHDFFIRCSLRFLAGNDRLKWEFYAIPKSKRSALRTNRIKKR